jgi:hypothetical protein
MAQDSEEQLKRLKREIERLKSAVLLGNVEDVKDHSYNACVIAHHLFDFAHVEYGGSMTLNNFRDPLVSEHQCLGVMHDVATGSKHLSVSAPQSGLRCYDVETSAISYDLPSSLAIKGSVSREFTIPKVGGVSLLEKLDETTKFWDNYFKDLAE